MTSQSSQRHSSSTPWTSEGKLCPLVAQVMTIGVTSIEEQLVQMKEMLATMARTIKENDLKIVILLGKLGAMHDEGADSGVNKDADEEEVPPVEKLDAKPEPD
ncbi:hypothetical protein ACFX1X_019019 [Malus domestica]